MPSPQKLAAGPSTPSGSVRFATAVSNDPTPTARTPSPTQQATQQPQFGRAAAQTLAVAGAQAVALYGSHWVAEGRYFSQSELERETFVLRQGTETALAGDGLADETDPFTLERVVLEQRAQFCTLSFEQVYADGTRMGWRGELDSSMETLTNGEWTALSGAGMGARIGTFTAQRVDMQPAAGEEQRPSTEAELEQRPAEPGSPERASELSLRKQLEQEEEAQERAQIEAQLAAEARLLAAQEEDESARARQQARRVAALRVDGHPSLGDEFEKLLRKLLTTDPDGAHQMLRKAWVATSLRKGSARSVGQPNAADTFLLQHADEPVEFWALDPEQVWFSDDTGGDGEIEYFETDVTRFDRGCFNGDYVPVLAAGATVGWPHFLNGFGRFLYRTAQGRWNFSSVYGPELASSGGDQRERGVASTREGEGEVPIGPRRWKGKQPGKWAADAKALALTITEEPVMPADRDTVEPVAEASVAAAVTMASPDRTPMQQQEQEQQPTDELDRSGDFSSPIQHPEAAYPEYASAENSALRMQLGALHVQAESQIAEASRSSTSLRIDLQSSREECTQLRRELALVTAPVPPDEHGTEWSAELRAEIARLHEVEADNAALRGNVAVLQEDLRTQKAEAARSASELQVKHDENQRVRSELTGMTEENIRASQGEAERADQQRQLVENVARLHKQLEDQERSLRNELAGRDDLIARMRAEAAADGSQQKLTQASFEAGSSTQRAEFVALETHSQRLEAERDSAQLEALRVERDNEALSGELDGIKQRDSQRKALDLALEKELERLRAIEVDQQEVLRDAQAAQEAHDEYVRKLGEQLDESQIEIEETREECASLRMQKEELAVEMQQISEGKSAAVARAAKSEDELGQAQAVAVRLNQEKEAILKQGAHSEQQRGSEAETAVAEASRLALALSVAERKLAAAQEEALAHARAAARSEAESKTLVTETAASVSQRVEAAVQAARDEMRRAHAKLTEAHISEASVEIGNLELAMGEAHKLADIAEARLREVEAERDALQQRSAGTAAELERLTQAQLELLAALDITYDSKDYAAEVLKAVARLQQTRDAVGEAGEAMELLERRLQASEKEREALQLESRTRRAEAAQLTAAQIQEVERLVAELKDSRSECAAMRGELDEMANEQIEAAQVFTQEGQQAEIEKVNAMRAAEAAAQVAEEQARTMQQRAETIRRENEAEQQAHIAEERAWLTERQQLQQESPLPSPCEMLLLLHIYALTRQRSSQCHQS